MSTKDAGDNTNGAGDFATQPVGGVDPAARPELSRREAMKIVRQVFGPKGRIWQDAKDGYSCGWDGNPGRKVVLRGPDLWLMLFGRYLPPGVKPTVHQMAVTDVNAVDGSGDQ